MKKFYCTKYCLTKGITMVEGDPVDGEDFVQSQYLYLRNNEWAFTFKEAQKQAETKRLKKIKLLKKQLAKLETLDFFD